MSAQQAQVPLIPREMLFGNPDRQDPKLSPNGLYLSYIAPYRGVLNIWLRTVGETDDRVLTEDQGRGIRSCFWAYNGSQVIYTQDLEGDENHRLFVIDINTREIRCLTPPDPAVAHKVQAVVVARCPERPHEMLIGLNSRDETCHDIYHLDLRHGEIKLVQESWPDVMEWLVDNDMNLRGCMEALHDGGSVLKLRDGASGAWHELLRWSQEDVLLSGVASFTPDNAGLFLLDSNGRNTSGLARYDIASGSREWLASDEQYDISRIEMHPTKHTVQAVGLFRERMQWLVLDPEEQSDFEYLRTAIQGDLQFYSRTLDNARWLVGCVRDDGPLEYYIYDRGSGGLQFLFSNREALADAPLVHMQPVQFAARDGLALHGYLSLPLDWSGPGPLVLDVHGGPWGRDVWGLNIEAQWFANRGYACLQVNFRGSMGYGKEFTNAGDREWGGKMQDDLSDAVAWAVAERIADPQRVVIYGGSYGGYATLAGVTFTPELYTAGVSIVGPSNMETFLNSIPPYWESFRRQMDLRVGRIPRYADGERAGEPMDEEDWDIEDRAEVEFLRRRSPLFAVDNVRVPMLIAQGANDPRVKAAESEQFVSAMRAKGLDVEYVVYANEGHGFARPENRLDFYARAESFLARILGGRYEP